MTTIAIIIGLFLAFLIGLKSAKPVKIELVTAKPEEVAIAPQQRPDSESLISAALYELSEQAQQSNDPQKMLAASEALTNYAFCLTVQVSDDWMGRRAALKAEKIVQ